MASKAAERISRILDLDSLGASDLRQIADMREAMWAEATEGANETIKIRYLGRSFNVSAGVFRPHLDSQPLVTKMVIPSGAEVLDIGTGCGVIAIFAALKGASRVVATDVDRIALCDAKMNACFHHCDETVETVQSDIFDDLPQGRRFDVITANLPFTAADADFPFQRTMYDPGMKGWRKLFEGVADRLNAGGALYVAQANFGNVEVVLDLAEMAGLTSRLIARRRMRSDPRVFYAFEMRWSASRL